MNFSIYPKTKITYEEEIKTWFENFSYVDINDINKNDYVFVFGGDGTFIKFIKEYDHKEINVVFINEGKVGFLSSIEKNEMKNMIFENFDYIYFLKIKTNQEEINVVNELLIDFNKLYNLEIFINNIKLEKCYFSKIFLINYLGTTGLARSMRFPILDRSLPSFIFDVLDAPQYTYNPNLNQAMILFKDKKVRINLKKEEQFFEIKYDNLKKKINSSFLEFFLSKSKSKYLNINDFDRFMKNIKKLF